MKRQRTAFTLVEILIVTAIIALLVAISIPHLLRVRVEANQVAARAVLKTISTALETYASDKGMYPVNVLELVSAVPRYLNRDYFSGAQHGYLYSVELTPYSYSLTATPASQGAGTRTFTMTTGGVLSSAP